MHSLVPVDSLGNPVAPVAVVPDRRAVAAHTSLCQEVGVESIYRITGGRLDPTTVLAKAVHFHRSENSAWHTARWFLPAKDFLRFRLTGKLATDPTDAAGTLLWNLNTGGWENELVALAGLTDRLPPIAPTLSLVPGGVSPEVATELGLPAGTPVVMGGGDNIETLGVGAIRPGDLFEHLGTTGSLYAVKDRPIYDPKCRIEVYPDVVPNRFLSGGSTSAAGSAIRWIREATGQTDNWEATHLVFDEMANKPLNISDLPYFLPYLSGERAPLWDYQRAGAFLGLRPTHTPADMVRAVTLGVLFSLRDILGTLEEIGATIPGSTVHGAGPLGANASLGQVRANIYNRPVVHRGDSEHATSFAAMVLATCAVFGDSPDTFAQTHLPIRWKTAPESNPVCADFAQAFRRYKQGSELLESFDSQLESEKQFV